MEHFRVSRTLATIRAGFDWLRFAASTSNAKLPAPRRDPPTSIK
jgi:hypothetical protein